MDLFYLSAKVTPNIAYYLPRNVSKAQVEEMMRESYRESHPLTSGKSANTAKTNDTTTTEAEAAEEEAEEEDAIVCEMQTERIHGKPKAITVYFGDLARTSTPNPKKKKKKKKKKTCE